jgi:tellurite resistance protein
MLGSQERLAQPLLTNHEHKTMGLLDRFTTQLKSGQAKKVNKDVFEAIAAAFILVAAASGGISKDELKNGQITLANHNKIKGAFSASDVSKIVIAYATKIEASPMAGKAALLREIGDLRNAEGDDSVADCEDVFLIAYDIAASDGEVDATETVVLKQIATKLGLTYEDYVV